MPIGSSRRIVTENSEATLSRARIMRGQATPAVVAPAIANRLTAVRREISFKSFGGFAFEIFMVTVP